MPPKPIQKTPARTTLPGTPAGKKRKHIGDSSDPDSSAASPSTRAPKQKGQKKIKHEDEANVTEDKKHESEADAYEKALPALEAAREVERKKLSENAKLSAPFGAHGVYVVGIRPTTEGAGQIAGYLNLHSTRQLNDVLEAVGKPFRDVLAAAKKSYGYTLSSDSEDGKDGKVPSFIPDRFFKHLKDGTIHLQDIEDDGEPDTQRYPRDPTNPARLELYVMRFVHSTISLLSDEDIELPFPRVFTGNHPGAESITYLPPLNIPAEDIYRAVMLLKFGERKSGKAGGGSRGFYNSAIHLPIFQVGAVVKVMDPKTQRRQAIALEELLKGGPGGFTSEQLIAKYDDATPLDAEEGQEFDNVLLKTMNESASRIRQDMDPMDDATRRAVLRALGAQAQVLYEDNKFQDRTFFDCLVDDEVNCHKGYNLSMEEKLEDALDGKAANDEAARKRFLQLNNATNRSAAVPAPFADACRDLGIELDYDLEEPDPVTSLPLRITWRGMALKPWQPQGIHWLLYMLESPIQAAILSDDTGLGKTVQSFATIIERSHRTEAAIQEWMEARNAIVRAYDIDEDVEPEQWEAVVDEFLADNAEAAADVQELGPKPDHRPVLVTVPPQALGTWLHDFNRFFNTEHPGRRINLRTFCSLGSGAHASAKDRTMAIHPYDAPGLEQCIAALDPGDSLTSRTVIVTTLQAFHKKVLINAKLRYTVKPRKNTADEADEDGDDDDADDDADDDDDAATQRKKREMESYVLDIKDTIFSLVIVDEAHKVKGAINKQTEAMYLLQKCAYILITATPFKNSVKDLSGLMRFAWKHLKGAVNKGDPPNRKSFGALLNSLNANHNGSIMDMDRATLLQYCRVLDPDNYRALCSSDNMDEDEASQTVVPLPSQMLILRRVKGSHLDVGGDLECVIGGDIPPWHCITVELRQGLLEKRIYSATVQEAGAMKDAMYVPDDDDNGGTRGANSRRRRLILATFNTQLDQFFRRGISAGASTVNALNTHSMDSFTFYHASVKNDLGAQTLNLRVDIVAWLTSQSVKLHYLCRLILHHLIDQNEKMILWVNEPLTTLCVELLLSGLSIEYCSIRAGIKNSARVAAEHDFNFTPSTKIAVISSRSCQESMNLQDGGHVQVFMDIVSHPSHFQGIGRSSRIGQKHPVQIYILTSDETYDQCLQATYFSRFRTTLVSQNALSEERAQKLLAHATPDIKRRMEGSIAEDVLAENPTGYMARFARAVYAEAAIREMFGIRTNRDGAYRHQADFTRKNTNPVELIWRILQGGQIRAEVVGLLRKQGKGSGVEEALDDTPTRHPDQPIPADAQIIPNTNKFAQPMVNLPEVPTDVKQNELKRYVEKAVLEICALSAYGLHGITPPDFLRTRANWLPDSRKGKFEPWYTALIRTLEEVEQRKKDEASSSEDLVDGPDAAEEEEGSIYSDKMDVDPVPDNEGSLDEGKALIASMRDQQKTKREEHKKKRAEQKKKREEKKAREEEKKLAAIAKEKEATALEKEKEKEAAAAAAKEKEAAAAAEKEKAAADAAAKEKAAADAAAKEKEQEMEAAAAKQKEEDEAAAKATRDAEEQMVREAEEAQKKEMGQKKNTDGPSDPQPPPPPANPATIVLAPAPVPANAAASASTASDPESTAVQPGPVSGSPNYTAYAKNFASREELEAFAKMHAIPFTKGGKRDVLDQEMAAGLPDAMQGHEGPLAKFFRKVRTKVDWERLDTSS